ncbi:hypothetical protein EW145_g1339 [Phellinidium pouzarii]|uniref:Uncharacterized protein n=1 Tax=Phellinidium pouzarii TaxID=167371 RepID=A0A4S4LF58_9AGAM|nr:hypothetical protein EW145_g1339 [Phellinidium pouzarii]
MREMFFLTSSELIAILSSSPNLGTSSILGWGVRSFDDNALPSKSGSNIVTQNLGWVDAQHTLKLLSLFSCEMPKRRVLILEDVTNSLDPIPA